MSPPWTPLPRRLGANSARSTDLSHSITRWLDHCTTSEGEGFLWRRKRTLFTSNIISPPNNTKKCMFVIFLNFVLNFAGSKGVVVPDWFNGRVYLFWCSSEDYSTLKWPFWCCYCYITVKSECNYIIVTWHCFHCISKTVLSGETGGRWANIFTQIWIINALYMNLSGKIVKRKYSVRFSRHPVAKRCHYNFRHP